MNADLLLHGISQVVTPLVGSVEAGPVHGRAMRKLRITPDAAIAVTNGHIVWVGRKDDWTGKATAERGCRNSAVLPALVDPHTHAVWAGDRLPDFEARVSGVSYEQILAGGGGIRSTIRQTAECSPTELAELAKPRIEAILRSGAATIEIKSGYGFEPAAELRMLEAVELLRQETRAALVTTLLIHIPPPDEHDRADYLLRVQRELIPEAARRKLASALDVFVEKEAWSAPEAESLFQCAREHGWSTKLHTEQFHRVGGLELGIRAGSLSVDHLEALTPEQIPALARSGVVGTILPGVTLHLGIPAAPGRSLIDGGAAVAVGTDLNPGSSPLFSAQAALALSVRLNGLTPAEALTAATVNAAAALGLRDRGRIAPGCRADLLVLGSADWRVLAYTLGANPISEVWVGGQLAS